MSARLAVYGAIVCILLCFPFFVSADIRINEFSPQTNPEWVELYNPDDIEHSFSGMVLYFDDSVASQKLIFCNNSILAAKTSALITRPMGSYWLSNAGDTLFLKKEDDTIDSISYGSGQTLSAPEGTQSASRMETGEWIITDIASPQGDQINFVCPTSTPTPEPTVIPTNTPIPASTSTPVPTKTPTSTSAPTKKPTPTSTPPAEQDQPLDETPLPSPTSAVLGVQDEKPQNNKPYIIALLLISIGCALLGAVFVIKNKLYLKR